MLLPHLSVGFGLELFQGILGLQQILVKPLEGHAQLNNVYLISTLTSFTCANSAGFPKDSNNVVFPGEFSLLILCTQGIV